MIPRQPKGSLLSPAVRAMLERQADEMDRWRGLSPRALRDSANRPWEDGGDGSKCPHCGDAMRPDGSHPPPVCRMREVGTAQPPHTP